MKVRVRFEPRDLWLGVFLHHERLFICVVPCLPVVIER